MPDSSASCVTSASAADVGHEALVGAAALLHTILQSAHTSSHSPVLVKLLPPLANVLTAATQHLRQRLAALPCTAPWLEAEYSVDAPAAVLHRVLSDARSAGEVAGGMHAPHAADALVTAGRLFERTAAGAVQAAASAVGLLDACSALLYDACDRCIRLRDGAGEAMDAMDMRRVALAAGMTLLPRALDRQTQHNKMCASREHFGGGGGWS